MSDELVFVPFGGCREIGMNLNAYGFGPAEARRWLIVDVGVTFADGGLPGVDLVMADPSWLLEQTIEGIVLTHAHEDHIGAIGHLWEYIRAPIYASAFAMELVRNKLDQSSLSVDPPLRVVRAGQRMDIGPFSVTLVSLTHSIPEMNALHVVTSAGAVFHTGDWKIDVGPMIGATVDGECLAAIGASGIDAMVCDSTNVFEEGEAGSEASVAEVLRDLVSEQTGAVAIACFASNVARLSSACAAARESDRAVVLVGRSMERVVEAAQSVGYLEGVRFLSADRARSVPSEALLYLCTGSQGEPRAALGRIARGDHPEVSLVEGDCVIFSSREIPGNEVAIAGIQNSLAERGIVLITERTDGVHVSGHPCREELLRMYGWIRPRVAIPVHGERRHCLEHARYARELGVAEAISPDNGQMVRICPDAGVIGEVPTGRMVMDGRVLVPGGSSGLRERVRLSEAGHISVSVAVGDQGRILDGPYVFGRGLSESDGRAADESLEGVCDAASEVLARMRGGALRDDDEVTRRVIRAVRSACKGIFGKRPLIDVHVLRL